MLAEIRKELDHNGHVLRLMQSISYTKQYDLDTGEMSYREIRQSIVRLHWQSKTVVYTSITEVIVETVGTMTKPLRGGAISNLFIGETNWSYCLI